MIRQEVGDVNVRQFVGRVDFRVRFEKVAGVGGIQFGFAKWGGYEWQPFQS